MKGREISAKVIIAHRIKLGDGFYLESDSSILDIEEFENHVSMDKVDLEFLWKIPK